MGATYLPWRQILAVVDSQLEAEAANGTAGDDFACGLECWLSKCAPVAPHLHQYIHTYIHPSAGLYICIYYYGYMLGLSGGPCRAGPGT